MVVRTVGSLGGDRDGLSHDKAERGGECEGGVRMDHVAAGRPTREGRVDTGGTGERIRED